MDGHSGDSGSGGGGLQQQQEQQWVCARCALLNSPAAAVCADCDATRSPTEAAAKLKKKSRRNDNRRRRHGGGGGGGKLSGMRSLLAAQLGSRLRSASLTPGADDESQGSSGSCSDAAAHAPLPVPPRRDDPLTWLGQLPADGAVLEGCIHEILDLLETSDSPFAAAAAQLRGARSVLLATQRAYASADIHGVPRTAWLRQVYARMLELLQEVGLPFAHLHVVMVVCAGGTPWAYYGLGGLAVEQAAQAQFRLARDHGLVFDLVPVLFSDVGSHLLKLAVAAGACVLAKLRVRDAGNCAAHALMWGCKGTLAAALAAQTYLVGFGGGGGGGGRGGGGGCGGGGGSGGGDGRRVRSGGGGGGDGSAGGAAAAAGGRPVASGPAVPPAPVALVGFGTDLLQGFADRPWFAECRRRRWCPVLCLNSLQDDAVGGGGAAVLARLAGEGERGGAGDGGLSSHMYDVEALMECDGSRYKNAGHSWYGHAFHVPSDARSELPYRAENKERLYADVCRRIREHVLAAAAFTARADAMPAGDVPAVAAEAQGPEERM